MLSWIFLADGGGLPGSGDPRIAFQSLLSWIFLADPGPRSRSTPRPRCFNPCCRGSSSLTIQAAITAVNQPRFQSLLSWIFLADFHGGDGDAYIQAAFQSLLSWIFLADSTPASSRGSSGPRFNPCCRGSSSLTFMAAMATPISRRRFNPCCRGSSSLTRLRPVLGGRPVRVSILVVVDLPR